MLNLISKYKVTLIVILLIITSFLYTYFKKDDLSAQTSYDLTETSWEDEEKPTSETSVTVQEPVEVPVYICGEIKNPGVYYILSSAIVNDLITKAGGLTKEADAMQVNLARLITPNEKIYIPKLGEEIDKMSNSYDNEEGQVSGNTLVNINLADSTLLDTLPGIGASRANTIISYREQNGAFKTIEDFKNVPGIGEKIYEALKERITVE